MSLFPRNPLALELLSRHWRRKTRPLTMAVPRIRETEMKLNLEPVNSPQRHKADRNDLHTTFKREQHPHSLTKFELCMGTRHDGDGEEGMSRVFVHFSGAFLCIVVE